MIAVICSSNRPHLWQQLYCALSQNKTPFNLTIVGPYPPIYSLPPNFKFMKSGVKPVQCFFIALHNTEGEYVIPLVDDMIPDQNSLDSMVNILSTGGKYDAVTLQYVYNRTLITHEFMVVKIVDPENPDIDEAIISFPVPVPFCPMMRKTTMMEVGIDKAFVAGQWDLDVVLELASRGGTIYKDNHMIREAKCDTRTRSSHLNQGDFTLLMEMWVEKLQIADGDVVMKDGKRYRQFSMLPNRRKPINPLEYAEDVEYRSQGNSGIWG